MTAPPIRRRARGFTLVELVVALSAGIAVAGAAYMLSKSTLAAFEAEARMSRAQFSATMGLNRLAADIQRAGYMSNPNSMDPSSARICGNKSATVANAKAVRITKGDVYNRAPISALQTQPMSPDRIRLVGNFSSIEQFEFRTIQGQTVYLTMNDGPMIRTLNAAGNGGPTLDQIFAVGRMVRLVDSHGKETYSVVQGLACQGGACNQAAGITGATLTLAAGDPISDGAVCGDWVSGGLINPVSIIDYWVGAPTAAGDGISSAAQGLIASTASTDPSIVAALQQTGDANRTELVRTEMDPAAVGATAPTATSNPFLVPAPGLPASSDIVAEYAVDLNFSATIRTAPGPDIQPANYQRLDGDTSPAASFNAPNASSQNYVGIGVRLSIRERAPASNAPALGSPRARFDVFGVGNPALTTTRFARVRTLTQEVSLQNLMGVQW